MYGLASRGRSYYRIRWIGMQCMCRWDLSSYRELPVSYCVRALQLCSRALPVCATSDKKLGKVLGTRLKSALV